jgi:hypothetical protein
MRQATGPKLLLAHTSNKERPGLGWRVCWHKAVGGFVDLEFHYYMTYLIASRAGYSPDEAVIVAHAAQSVDDNHIPLSVYWGLEPPYKNRISQTMDITDPHGDSLIYPIFHFIPGDPQVVAAKRKDGMESPWITTPNSVLANRMINAALASDNLYRIGAAIHGYADTWAHQNFLGKRDLLNVMPGAYSNVFVSQAMAIGHAQAKHLPDIPALVWQDGRLVNETIDNRARFLDAAEHILEKLVLHRSPNIDPGKLAQERSGLRADLDQDIGPSDDARNRYRNDRIERHILRSMSAQYGGQAIPRYVEGEWFSEAINESHREIETAMRNSVVSFLSLLPNLSDLAAFAEDKIAHAARQACTWRSPDGFEESHWYQFQEAIKSHFDECQKILLQEGLDVESHSR